MNIKPKKSLGQNFLSDKNIIKSIVEVGSIKKNNTILEIGPGTGNLTSCILKKNPKKFFVIEKDNELANNLSDKFKDQITIINDDVLKINEITLFKEKVSIFLSTNFTSIYYVIFKITTTFGIIISLKFNVIINVLS